MTNALPTPTGQALTDMILTMFRTTNLTLAWGDRLVSGLGLTSARWQVLGAITAAERPQPVAWLARDLGANRQNVQRIVNDLHKEGLVRFEPNPHHRRAQHVVLTDEGHRRYDAALKLYFPPTNKLADAFAIEDIAVAHHVLVSLRAKLETELSPLG